MTQVLEGVKPSFAKKLHIILEATPFTHNTGGAPIVCADVDEYFQVNHIKGRRSVTAHGDNAPRTHVLQNARTELPSLSIYPDYKAMKVWADFALTLFEKTTSNGMDHYEYRKLRRGIGATASATIEAGEEGCADRAVGGAVQSWEWASGKQSDPEGTVSLVAAEATRGVAMTGATARPEIQQLVFTNVPAVQEFLLRVVGGGNDFFVFKATDSNATIKAGIEARAAFAGFTVTVTGALTGTALKSGTLTLTYSPDGNLPALEILATNSQTLTLTNATGDGTWGGATVTPGDSEGDVQTALRNTGGSNANVVVKGSSTEVVEGYALSGAGDDDYIDFFFADGGVSSDVATYSSDTGKRMYRHASAQWYIGPDTNPTNAVYRVNDSSLTPPAEDWFVIGAGVGPAPTVASATGGGSGSYVGYWPNTAGAVALQNVTGTGFSRALTTAYQAIATTIVGSTTQAGGTGGVEPLEAAPFSSADWIASRAATLGDIDDADKILEAVKYGIKFDNLVMPRDTANGTRTHNKVRKGKADVTLSLTVDDDTTVDNDGVVDGIIADAENQTNNVSKPAWYQVKSECGDGVHACLFQSWMHISNDLNQGDDEDVAVYDLALEENNYSPEEYSTRLVISVPAGTFED